MRAPCRSERNPAPKHPCGRGQVQGELDSKNKALFFFTPGAYSIVLIFANFRPGAYSVVLIYISAEPVPGVLISGI